MKTAAENQSAWQGDPVDPNGFSEYRWPDGRIRNHWQSLVAQIDELDRFTLSQRAEAIKQFIRENGVTVQKPMSMGYVDRPWQLSPIPLVIDGNEWVQIRQGLMDRTRLLNAVLDDLLGPQNLIRERIIPGEIVWANPLFRRAYHGLSGAQQKLHIVATDLARNVSDGRWYARGDRTRAPSGMGYLLENRIATSRIMPRLIRVNNTHRLAAFFETLREHLLSLAPSHQDNPRIALLTPPTGNYRAFEDTYLARYLGMTLIQGSDLAVRGGELFLKTLGGLQPVQVLWRHVSDQDCDPLELDPNSSDGVSGLLRCIRRGSVSVVNSLGSVLAETPALMPYLDRANQFLFGEQLIVPTIPTYWCGDPDHHAFVMNHLDDLMFRDATAVSGDSPVVVSALSEQDRQGFLSKVAANPSGYIAQARFRFSTSPVWSGDQIESRMVALRSFQLVTSDSIEVLPGALARAGNNELELSQSPVSGQMALDCWISADGPVDHLRTLLSADDQPIQLRRWGDELPSRVAEHLYWLGRYAERAESVARVMRTTLIRISGEGNLEMRSDVRRLIHTLAVMGQIEASYAVDSLAANLPGVQQNLPLSVLDPEQPQGLIRTMDAVMYNATAVRDRLSIDAYRIVRRASRELRGADTAPVTGKSPNQLEIDAAIERMDTLIADLLALAGVTYEGFVRTHAWQFLELGRRIERSEYTCTLLIHTLCRQSVEISEICESVLETTDSLMTYRSRYMNRLRLAAVVDLLVTDATNPRSIRFQLDRLCSLVEKLPATDGPVGLDTLDKTLLDMSHLVTTADPLALCDIEKGDHLVELEEMLQQIADAMPVLSEALSARFLTHTDEKPLITGRFSESN